MAPAVCSVESKPGRSEEQGDAEQQARIAEAVRQKFEEEAPRRPLKPSRSDGSSLDPADAALQGPIPEYLKLQNLVEGSPSELILREYPHEASEEFVETEYYKDLYAVDKTMHHTTGTGFIQVEANGPPASYNSLPGAPVSNGPASYTSLPDAPSATLPSGTSDTPEEFVETEYYNDLNAVDKTLHHTTGTGFIQVESTTDLPFEVGSVGLMRTKSGCNPATNDWIPAMHAPDIEVSKKPNRSEL